MLVVKSIMPDASFAQVSKLGNRWVARVKMSDEPDENGLIEVAEGIVGHEPTADDFNAVVSELKEKETAMEILSIQYELNDGESAFIKAMESWFSANGTGEVKEIADARIALRARINKIGKTEIAKGGDGSEEKPFVFDDVSDLIPNAFYTYNGKKYVYMGVAQAKTTWADVESVMGEWY